MKEINGYHMLTELTTANSGFGQWAFVERNGVELFLKRFLRPVYPTDPALYDVVEFRNQRAYCDFFVQRKQQLYAELRGCRQIYIVPVLDFFRAGGKFYVITAAVKAVPVTEEELFSLPFAEKLRLLTTLCSAVAELHGHRIIHADLKPSNILFERDREGRLSPRIIDYDSSFLEGSYVAPREIEGDPVYLAPETFRAMEGQSVSLNGKIDVFALGVIFHQLLFGTLPAFFKGEDEYAFESAAAGRELVFPADADELSKKLIRGMLEKDPAKRRDLKKVASLLEKMEKQRLKKEKRGLKQEKKQDKGENHDGRQ